jgi:hypothetical protein
LPGAIISVRRANGGPEIARQKADSSGRFHLSLKPGVYVVIALRPEPGDGLPIGAPQKIVVELGQVLNVTSLLDTGIR